MVPTLQKQLIGFQTVWVLMSGHPGFYQTEVQLVWSVARKLLCIAVFLVEKQRFHTAWNRKDATCQCRPDIVLPTEWVPPDVIFHPANRTRVAVLMAGQVLSLANRLMQEYWKLQIAKLRQSADVVVLAVLSRKTFNRISRTPFLYEEQFFETNYVHFECDMDGRIASPYWLERIGSFGQWSSAAIWNCTSEALYRPRICPAWCGLPFKCHDWHMQFIPVRALCPLIMICLHRCPASWRCGTLHICRPHVFFKQVDCPQTFKKRWNRLAWDHGKADFWCHLCI